MCEQEDVKARRARDLERWHRRSEARRESGLCQSCGRAKVAPGRTRCEPCLEKRRVADRERHHKRTASRLAAGTCVRCGKNAPEPGRSTCSSCAKRDNAASRARDARLRAKGLPRRDPSREREYQRERRRRLYEERISAGLCSQVRPCPRAAGQNHLRGLRPKASNQRQAPPCTCQGQGSPLRRARSGGEAEVRAGEQPPTDRSPPRRRSLHPLRARPARRGQVDVRALPREQAAGKEGAPARTQGGRPLRQVRRALGWQGALRSLRRRQGQAVEAQLRSTARG